MRLHTSLPVAKVTRALADAKRKGHIAVDVQFTVLEPHGSRTRPIAYEVQLGVPRCVPYQPLPAGTVNKYGYRQRARRTCNGGGQAWAATWHEWGWFIAEIYAVDPIARWGSKSWGYSGFTDFNDKTGWKFVLVGEPAPEPEPETPVFIPGAVLPERNIFPYMSDGADPCGNPPIAVLS